MNPGATIANLIWGATNLTADIRFRRALRNPRKVQQDRLLSHVRNNVNTEFGKVHDFAGIHCYEDFARQVPLADYEKLSPWIEQIKQGGKQVLTYDEVTHLIPTSGTNGPRKLIPFTGNLQREFNAAIGAWLIDLLRHSPGIVYGPAYWSITPVISSAEPESSCVPIGFAADSAYLGGARQKLVDAVMGVPSWVQTAKSLEAFRYMTLLALLRCGDLRLISVWHPSFLSLLLDELTIQWERLLADVERGSCQCEDAFPVRLRSFCQAMPLPERARRLRSVGPNNPAELWPELRLVSCWADAASDVPATALGQRLSGIKIQPKGLIATEAFVTIPFGSEHPLAITSHFFEFMDSEERVFLADSIQQDEEYEVVVTTAGGLWRYRLGDRVKVTGFVEDTPSLRFLGRVGNVSDLFGEKLSEIFVTEAMMQIFQRMNLSPSFAMLAPDESSRGTQYTLYVEGATPSGVVQIMDGVLRQNPHYAYCRDIGQLLLPKLFVITGGAYEAFVGRQSRAGARMGDIKPSALNKSTGWSQVFTGNYAEPGI